MPQPIRTQAQIDAATEPAAKVRAAYMVDRLRDDLPHYANLRRGDLAKTGGVSIWQVVFVVALTALGTCLVIWFDPAGITWRDG